MNCAFCWGKAQDTPAVTIVNGHAVCVDHFIPASHWEAVNYSGLSYNGINRELAFKDEP